jgi:hypothetical protein
MLDLHLLVTPLRDFFIRLTIRGDCTSHRLPHGRRANVKRPHQMQCNDAVNPKLCLSQYISQPKMKASLLYSESVPLCRIYRSIVDGRVGVCTRIIGGIARTDIGRACVYVVCLFDGKGASIACSLLLDCALVDRVL